MRLVLASTSVYRRAQLEGLGLKFLAAAPDFAEEDAKKNDLPAVKLCELLAREKCISVVSKYPEDVVVAADQLVHCDGNILGKGLTMANTKEQILMLQGRTHELITSMAIHWPENPSPTPVIDTIVAKMTMHSLTDGEIEDYISADDTCNCAGGYKFESRGRFLFKAVEAEDESAIIGLPLLKLTSRLREIGFPLPYRKSSGGDREIKG